MKLKTSKKINADKKLAKQKKPGFLKNLLVSVITLVVIFLLIELIFRLFFPQPTESMILGAAPPMYVSDSYLPWVLKPNTSVEFVALYNEFKNHIRINSLGVRDDREISLAKEKGTYRIAVLGDSFTFGIGVESNQTFPKVLESLLNKQPKNKDFEVINFGAPGYGLAPYYVLLERRVLPSQPDMVIVSVLLANDVIELFDQVIVYDTNTGLPARVYSKTSLVEDNRLRLGNEGTRWYARSIVHKLLYRYSHFYTFIARTLSVASRHEENSYTLSMYECEYPPEFKEKWSQMEELVLGMKKMAENHNAKFVLAIIPYTDQISFLQNQLDNQSNQGEPAQSKAAVSGPEQSKCYDFRKPQELLMSFCAAHNITCVDPLDVYINQSQHEGLYALYYSYDKHWTAAGHELFAQAIYKDIGHLIDKNIDGSIDKNPLEFEIISSVK